MPKTRIGATSGGPRLLSRTRVATALETSQRQLGLLWGTVSVVLLMLVPQAGQFARALPACTFKTLVGIPCPTCGITRTTLALTNLDFAAALRVNPLVTVLLMAFVAGGLIAGLLAIAGRPLREPRWDLRPGERLGLVAVLVANWAYLVSRGI